MGDFKIKTCGSVIRNARELKELSINELNIAINNKKVNDKLIQKWESSKAYPDLEMCYKLAEILEVSTDYLLGITDIRNYKTLHNDVNKNVESIYENTKEMLKQDGLMLYGKPATKDDIDNILKAMKVGMMMALQKDND